MVDSVRIPKYSQQSFYCWWQNIHYHLSMAKYTLPACLKFCLIHDHLANLWNRIATKILDMFRIIALKQHTFSQSDPVLIRQFSKKLPSDPVLILPKLASVLVQSDPVLIRAHLWKEPKPAGSDPDFWSPILVDYENFLEPEPDWISVLLKPDPDYPKLFENLRYV